jgi:tetratricopeptide (TPR) repeat protein
LRRKYTLIMLIVGLNAFAQNNISDSLLAVLKNAPDDTSRIKTLNLLSENSGWRIGNYDTAIYFAKKAKEIAITSIKSGKGRNDQTLLGIATSSSNIGASYLYLGDYENAQKNYKKALKINKVINNKAGIASCLSTIGYIYSIQGNYPEALKHCYEALRIFEELSNKKSIASCLTNIGNIYFYQFDYPEALKFYFATLEIDKELNNKDGIANCYNNIGSIYDYQDKFSESLEYHIAALQIRKEIDDKRGIAQSLTNIGNIHYHQKNFTEALKNQFESLELKEKIGNKISISSTLVNIGTTHNYLGKPQLGQKWFNQALKLAKEAGYTEMVKESYGGLAAADSALGNFKSAFENYKLYIHYRDSLFNDENSKSIMQQQMQYEFDKKEALAQAEQDKKDALTAAENLKQKVISWSAGSGLFLALSFAFFVVSRLRLTRKQKKIIEDQKLIVEEKNTEILDSIRYAKRIQEAILPSMDDMQAAIKNGFVLYKPKDVVAGDFYWMETLRLADELISGLADEDGTENNNHPLINQSANQLIFFAAADCTGHGVPGAMVSVICSNALSKALLEENITDPGKLLDRTREIVTNRLARGGEEVKDGMDISLCAIEALSSPLSSQERAGVRLQYAGANNPLWIIRPCHSDPDASGEESKDASLPLSMTDYELLEIKPDKQPIGKYSDQKPFTTHIIELQKGDTIYVFTDGYADQFGGPKGKKFKYAQLKELLLSIQAKTMDEQYQILNQKFEQWRGNLEQVDDVCVIGVRI